MIINPMLSFKAQEDDEEDGGARRIVFELHGETGERQEFSIDTAFGIQGAIEILESGLYLLTLMDEIGFDAAAEACELQVKDDNN